MKGKSLSDLEMLNGHWRGTSGDDIVEEYWLPCERENKACIFRWLKDDSSKNMFEAVIVVERNDEIHMLLRHFDTNLHAWEEKDSPWDFVATEISESTLTFVDANNPDSGFLHYDISKDRLRFRMFEPDETVKFELRFSRVV
jgi:hypothetical protein